MKKIILGVIAVAMLAIPTVAIASVAVDNGVGTVGKGDVQSALKWNNGDFDKNVGSLKFTGEVTRTTDNFWGCTDGSTQHRDRVVVMDQTFKTTAVLSSNGKQITGWNLSGATLPNTVKSDTGIPTIDCPDGSSLDFSRPFSYNNIGGNSTYVYSGLKVNGIDLPNTPVVVPAV